MTLIYPGSFDPITAGHMDIVRRAARFASTIIVAVLDNPDKKPLFSVEERCSFIKDAVVWRQISASEKGECADIKTDSFSGLLTEYAKMNNAHAILRGLRTSEDFERENKYAASNSALSRAFHGEEMETIFLPATPALTFVSSTIIREVAAHIYAQNLDDTFIAELVPPTARAALRKVFER